MALKFFNYLVLFFLFNFQNLAFFILFYEGLVFFNAFYLQSVNFILEKHLCFQNIICPLFPVCSVRFQVFNPFNSVIKIIGGKNEIQKIVIGPVLIRINHTFRVLLAKGIQFLFEFYNFRPGIIHICLDKIQLLIDIGNSQFAQSESFL